MRCVLEERRALFRGGSVQLAQRVLVDGSQLGAQESEVAACGDCDCGDGRLGPRGERVRREALCGRVPAVGEVRAWPDTARDGTASDTAGGSGTATGIPPGGHGPSNSAREVRTRVAGDEVCPVSLAPHARGQLDQLRQPARARVRLVQRVLLGCAALRELAVLSTEKEVCMIKDV